MTALVADRRGRTTEPNHHLFLVIGEPLLADPFQFFAQLLDRLDRVRRETHQTGPLDDPEYDLPWLMGKQHLSDARAVRWETLADSGQNDLESTIALKLFDVQHLSIDQHGKVRRLAPPSDQTLHDRTGRAEERTRVEQRLTQLEQRPAETVTASGRSLQETFRCQGTQKRVSTRLGDLQRCGDLGDPQFRLVRRKQAKHLCCLLHGLEHRTLHTITIPARWQTRKQLVHDG